MKVQRRNCALVLFLGLAAASAGLAQQAAPLEAPQTATIAGTVLDVNGGTVPGASVILQGPTSADRAGAITSDDGSFKFAAVRPGIPYHVSISARDFASWTSDALILQPGQFYQVNQINLRLRTVQSATTVVPEEELAVQQVKEEEHQRVLGFIPNFYIAYNPDAVPLTTKLKFQLAMRTLIDPVTLTGVGLNAATYQALNYPHYGQGAEAFGKRLGATFADSYTNVLIGDAVLPSLLHQDPRYFYQGTGSKKSRFMHVVGSALFTRGDDGRQHINYSAIGGDLAAGAMSNAYYPNRDRGPALVLTSAAAGFAGRVFTGIMQEFVLPRFTQRENLAAEAP